MPVVHNFTTIQKLQHDDARDIVEYIQAKSVIDDKIERNDMQDEIQSEKDHTNPVVQELAVREEEAERQALEDKIKRDNNVPVNESKELDRLRKKYYKKLDVAESEVKGNVSAKADKNRKANQHIKLESSRIDALNDSIFFDD